VAIPVAIPVEEPIVATPIVELLHVPPPELDKVVVRPEQIVVAPVMAEGNGLTVNTDVILQLVGNV
jgi:hypothetical protein